MFSWEGAGAHGAGGKALTPFLCPGGHRGLMVGMGSGLLAGMLVLERPAPVFSRGRASLSGVTGLVAPPSPCPAPPLVSVTASGAGAPLLMLLSELLSISLVLSAC